MSQSIRGVAAAALACLLVGCGSSAPAGQPAEPEAVPAVVAEPEPPPIVREIRVARIEPRQTLATALEAMALSGNQVVAVVRALDGVFDFRKSRVGDQIRLTLLDGQLESMEYRASATDEWIVRRDGEGLIGYQRALRIEPRIELVDLAIESSLYESMVAAGEDPGFAVDLADVFAWDIDFYRDVRRGDRLRAVVEKQYAQGRLLRYGPILGAQYEGEVVGRRRLLRYEPLTGEPGYFDEEGASAKKTFLKSPLKYAHITSRYGARRHPVLGYTHTHQGVDFRAAIGTPVWSVADGTVTRLVKGDRAAGNYLYIRHMNGFETGYLHLSRFAPGLRVGARVKQKQVIAYSGNTGRSTGPHLHFSMKRAGRFVNPLAQKFPRAEPLPKSELARFAEQTAAIAAMLSGERIASNETGAEAPAGRSL